MKINKLSKLIMLTMVVQPSLHLGAEELAKVDEEDSSKLQTITITATRRPENLQETPIAVSAIDGSVIEKEDIHDLTDIATRVPGLTFSPFSPGQNILALRGASSNDDGAGTDNSIAVFIDDVYMGRVSNINPEMFDIDRIEVLRGPQGTLYGKNTLGGAINVISTKPYTEEVSGKMRATISNYGGLNLGGLISGPLSENREWAGKLSFISRKRNGWVDNVLLNKKQKDDNTQAIRGQLLYTGDSFEALFSIDHNRLDAEDMARIPVDTGRPGDPAVWSANVPGLNTYAELCAGRGPDCSANPVNGFAKKEAGGASAKLTWDLDNGQLISITAFRESEADWEMDSTGTTLLALIDDIFDESEQFSQELRWVSQIDDDIEYVAGLWYLQEETDRTECFDLSLDSDCTLDADGGTTDWYRQVNETTGYAAFGQLKWNFTENWNLTLGGRYSFEEKEIDNQTVQGDFVIINQSFSNSVKADWSAFTPSLSLAYQPTFDTNIYATISQGFKSGGFAAAPQGIDFTKPLAQEEATNYELGIKSDLSDYFRLNVSAFHVEYEGLQIQTFGPLTTGASFGTFQTFNSGDAEVTGIELEATWVITENLTFSGFYAYQDSEFGTTNIAGTAFPNQKGEALIRTPKNKYSFNLDYGYFLDNGSEISANISYRFTGDQRGELEPWAIQPEFNLVDARVNWKNSDESFELSLWGKNLNDEEYITHLYTIASSVVAVYGDPMTYGVTATYNF